MVRLVAVRLAEIFLVKLDDRGILVRLSELHILVLSVDFSDCLYYSYLNKFRIFFEFLKKMLALSKLLWYNFTVITGGPLPCSRHERLEGGY